MGDDPEFSVSLPPEAAEGYFEFLQEGEMQGELENATGFDLGAIERWLEQADEIVIEDDELVLIKR